MKIKLPVWNHDFKIGVGGGEVWVQNLTMSLNEIGKKAVMVSLEDDMQDADTIIIQSEWYGQNIGKLRAHRRKGGKLIVLLGHFTDSVYFDPKKIEADEFWSTWKGDCIDNFPYPIKYVPHGYNRLIDNGKSENNGITWIGNSYPLRGEEWFEGIEVNRIKTPPENLSSIYRGSDINLNLHAPIQKGETSDLNSNVLNKGETGFALNERLFWIAGAGGFQICDEHPLIWEHFKKGDIETAETKEEYQEKVKYYLKHPEKRESFIKRALKRDNSYTSILKKLL